MKKHFDVVVIGGGPAGLGAAALCEKKGLDILVLEEHKQIGIPLQCSGLISANLAKLVKIDESFVEHTVRGAILHSGKEELVLEKKDTAAYVIDRHKFDSYLAEQVKSEILLGTKATCISIKKDGVAVKAKNKIFTCDLLFGCDGPNSMVRNHFRERPQETVTGIIAMTNEENHSPYVEMWYDKTIAPDGFAWKIPRGKRTEYGMLSSNPDFRTMEKFFGIKNYAKSAGLIPFGFQKTYFERTLLIGDSASQVKPWSGGGVIYSLTAARIAADVAARAFSKNDFSEGFLKEYQERWHRKFGLNIALGMLFRRAYKEIGSKRIEEIFRVAKKLKKINVLDMDFPSLSLKELL